MTEYWTMHWFGTYQVCSRHKSFEAAQRAAIQCESGGGSCHDIWRCEKMKRKKCVRAPRK